MVNRNSGMSDYVLGAIVKLTMAFVLLITVYPFVYVLSMSISSTDAVLRNKVWLYPVGFSLRTYRLVLTNGDVLSGYYNSAWYTLVGGSLSTLVTVAGAYALSRREFKGRLFFMKLVVFTMFFSGGMIPSFLLVRSLGIFDTRWAIVLPPLVGAWNLIISRTYLESTPESLIESAKIDGHNDISIFARIVLPISMPIVAVVFLFYAVDRWNNYFSALLYLRKAELRPLQIYLMNILVFNVSSRGFDGSQLTTNLLERASLARQLRYALIMVTVTPILVVYPFVQKYFVQGVMIGSLKE